MLNLLMISVVREGPILRKRLGLRNAPKASNDPLVNNVSLLWDLNRDADSQPCSIAVRVWSAQALDDGTLVDVQGNSMPDCLGDILNVLDSGGRLSQSAQHMAQKWATAQVKGGFRTLRLNVPQAGLFPDIYSGEVVDQYGPVFESQSISVLDFYRATLWRGVKPSPVSSIPGPKFFEEDPSGPFKDAKGFSYEELDWPVCLGHCQMAPEEKINLQNKPYLQGPKKVFFGMLDPGGQGPCFLSEEEYLEHGAELYQVYLGPDSIGIEEGLNVGQLDLSKNNSSMPDVMSGMGGGTPQWGVLPSGRVQSGF